MKLYKFIELSEEAQQHALELFRAQDWSDSTATDEEIRDDLSYDNDDMYTERGVFIPEPFKQNYL